MTLESTLGDRANATCELCGATEGLSPYPVPKPGSTEVDADSAALLCPTCTGQIAETANLDPRHWHCLKESMWSTVPAVQVLASRMLHRLEGEIWARELAEMLYLDDDLRAWAEAGIAATATEGETPHKDCHGAVLAAGDTVTLIKDLNVKGANFTAKRGTAVRGISLVPDNPAQIEGRVNGQQIVILTEFVKKSG